MSYPQQPGGGWQQDPSWPADPYNQPASGQPASPAGYGDYGYQQAAYSSLLLFENLEHEMKLEPIELAYKLMTRSKKIDHEKLRRRDPGFVAAYEAMRSRDETRHL